MALKRINKVRRKRFKMKLMVKLYEEVKAYLKSLISTNWYGY